MRENQQTYRHANERLRGLLIDSGTIDHRHVPFFCECADEECSDRLDATLDEFDDAHSTYQHFFILPGHTRMDREDAVEENGRYEVVTKENV